MCSLKLSILMSIFRFGPKKPVFQKHASLARLGFGLEGLLDVFLQGNVTTKVELNTKTQKFVQVVGPPENLKSPKRPVRYSRSQ